MSVAPFYLYEENGAINKMQHNTMFYLSVVNSEVDDEAQQGALCLVANLLGQSPALGHLQQETGCRVD